MQINPWKRRKAFLRRKIPTTNQLINESVATTGERQLFELPKGKRLKNLTGLLGETRMRPDSNDKVLVMKWNQSVELL